MSATSGRAFSQSATTPAEATRHGPWLLAPGIVEELGGRIPGVVTRYRQLRPLEPGPPIRSSTIIVPVPARKW